MFSSVKKYLNFLVISLVLLSINNCSSINQQPSFLPLGKIVDVPVGYYGFCATYEKECQPTVKNNYLFANNKGFNSKYSNVFSESKYFKNLTNISKVSFTNAPLRQIKNNYVQRLTYIKNKANFTPPQQVSFVKYGKTILSINKKINNIIKPKTDFAQFRKFEKWSLPISYDNNSYGDCEDYALEKRIALIKAGVPKSSLFLATAKSKRTGLHAVLIVSTDKGDIVLDNLYNKPMTLSSLPYSWEKRQSPYDPSIWYSATNNNSKGSMYFANKQSTLNL